jgi:hypothetical protein
MVKNIGLYLKLGLAGVILAGGLYLWTDNVSKKATIVANEAALTSLTQIAVNQTNAINTLEKTMKENEENLRGDINTMSTLLGKYKKLTEENNKSISAVEDAIKGIDDVKVKECMDTDVPDPVFNSLFKYTETRSDKRSGSSN